MSKRSWSKEDLVLAVKSNRSVRGVIKQIGLIPSGGNYKQINYHIEAMGLSKDHFTGKLWSKGLSLGHNPKIPLEEILVKNSGYQSYKLKHRLFLAGLKKEECEECGWKKQSIDGRIPVELDHINGDNRDNRLENLRILCPNCHSLKPNHRGKNIKKLAG
ncbi:HNH endonuclease [Patescibacteria group bacterium]|nr:HNH endonuclease [Patescibacteria group bacterium]